MGKEVVTINVGQFGVQLADSLWRQYCCEHNVTPMGTIEGETIRSNHILFEETREGRLVPRDICVDLDPSTIDVLANSRYGSLFHPDRLIRGKEDGANIFARGHYTVGREKLEDVLTHIRKMVEQADRLEGYMMQHAITGGTGSGFGVLILEQLANLTKKRPKLGLEIFPSANISQAIVEPYNALLTSSWLLEQSDISLCFDNEQMYKICSRNMDIAKPSYSDVNKLIAKTASTMTNSLRFPGQLPMEFREFQLLPIPQLHFMNTSYAPIICQSKLEYESQKVADITGAAFEPYNFFMGFDDFNWQEDKYMAMTVTFRGNFPAKNAFDARSNRMMSRVTFSEHFGGSCKMSMTDIPIKITPWDTMVYSESSITMIGNNTAMGRMFNDRIARKYDLMYSQRSYVHWYVGEGMEEGEFEEAREAVEMAINDYRDVAGDDDDDDENL